MEEFFLISSVCLFSQFQAGALFYSVYYYRAVAFQDNGNCQIVL